MDGLTNIITKINEQNKAQCDAVIESAKQKAAEIVAKAEAQADELVKKQTELLEAKSAAEKSKAEASAMFEYKRVMLEKKCALIDDCTKSALEKMCNASDEEYFGYITSLALKHALKGEGSMSLSDKDIKRLPDGFEKMLNEKLGEGRSITVSDKTIVTDGGFVISYPEMRVDCTFSSLLEENADGVKDAINRILFS